MLRIVVNIKYKFLQFSSKIFWQFLKYPVYNFEFMFPWKKTKLKSLALQYTTYALIYLFPLFFCSSWISSPGNPYQNVQILYLEICFNWVNKARGVFKILVILTIFKPEISDFLHRIIVRHLPLNIVCLLKHFYCSWVYLHAEVLCLITSKLSQVSVLFKYRTPKINSIFICKFLLSFKFYIIFIILFWLIIQYQSKKLRQIFSFNNIKNCKLIWNFLSFIFNALCKPIWKWFNHIWYCFIFNFIVCIFDFYNQFCFFVNLFLYQLRLYFP